MYGQYIRSTSYDRGYAGNRKWIMWSTGHSPRRRPDRVRLRGWSPRAAVGAARANQRAPKRGRLTKRDRTTRRATIQRCQRSIGPGGFKLASPRLSCSAVQLLSLHPNPPRHHLLRTRERTMFVTRAASTLARRTPVRALAKRSFSSSIIRCTWTHLTELSRAGLSPSNTVTRLNWVRKSEDASLHTCCKRRSLIREFADAGMSALQARSRNMRCRDHRARSSPSKVRVLPFIQRLPIALYRPSWYLSRRRTIAIGAARRSSSEPDFSRSPVSHIMYLPELMEANALALRYRGQDPGGPPPSGCWARHYPYRPQPGDRSGASRAPRKDAGHWRLRHETPWLLQEGCVVSPLLSSQIVPIARQELVMAWPYGNFGEESQGVSNPCMQGGSGW